MIQAVANASHEPQEYTSLTPWWVAGVAACGLLASIFWQLQAIPEQLSASARAMLSAQGLDQVGVSADGRDLTLTGQIDSTLDRSALRIRLEALPGVLSVQDSLQIAEAGGGPGQALSGAPGRGSAVRSAAERAQLQSALDGFDLSSVQFASGTTSLTADAAPTLDALAAWLAGNPEVSLRVEGHTDNTGRDDINLRISRQRAAAVVAALVERGITASRLLARGYGASRPVASNDVPEGQALNRRIELSLIY